MKRKHFVFIALVCVSLLFRLDPLYAQCGTETFAVKDWCENQYAEWTITNPDPNSIYHWFEPVYNAAGTVVDTIDRGYGEDGTGIVFSSPIRYTTPVPTPTTAGWDKRRFWYSKETPVVTGPASQNNSPTRSNSPTYSVNFTSTTRLRFNTITIPIAYDYIAPDANFDIQVRFGTLGTAVMKYKGSDISTSPKSPNSNTYWLTVPVNLDLLAGNNVISVVMTTNSASWLGFFPSSNFTFPIAADAGISITGSSTSGTDKAMIFDWDVVSICPYKFSTEAGKTTVGCCDAVINTLFNLGGASSTIVSNSGSTVLLTAGSVLSSSNYFAWYLDGAPIPSAAAVGKTTYNATKAGVYSVREVKLASDINNLSCYSQVSTNLDEKVIFASITSLPTTNPYCLGDQFGLKVAGNATNISWSPSKGLSSANSATPVYTATATGSTQFEVQGDIISGNRVLNGDFENGNDGTFTTDNSFTSGSPSKSQFSISTTVNTSGNSFWINDCTGNGKFYYSDSKEATNTIAWQQTVTGLSVNKNYTLKFSYNEISGKDYLRDRNTLDANPAIFAVLVNGQQVGTTFTTTGQACKWNNASVVWNSASAASAKIQIVVVNGDKSSNGVDFALDDIQFGGASTQKDYVTVGPITDCSKITAVAGTCKGDSVLLTATVSGGLVFDRWEYPIGTVVGRTNPIWVKPTEARTYTAIGILPIGNVLENGDFESGNGGFISGDPYYSPQATGWTQGGTNKYIIGTDTKLDNGSWLALSPPSGSGRMFVADAKPPVNQKIIAWKFTAANTGDKYLFSGQVANQHNAVPPPPANNPNGFTAPSAKLSADINGIKLVDMITPKDNLWHKYTATWTAPAPGEYTLTLTDITGLDGPGNDFVLDDFILAPIVGTEKKATVNAPACVTCSPPKVSITTSGPAPAVDVAPKKITICEGATNPTLSGSYTAGTTAPTNFYQYLWYKKGTPIPAYTNSNSKLGNANVAGAPTITSSIADSGTYYLRVEDYSGTHVSSCAAMDSVRVVINKKPNLSTTAPSAVCAPSTVSITGAWTDANSTNPIVTYYQGASSTVGTLITTTAAATISASGTYTVKGVNGTCSDEKTVVVTINSAPTTPTFTLDPNKTSFCLGDVYTLTAASTAGSTFKWDKASTATTAQITGNPASGTYTYDVVATLNGCSSSKGTQVITVNALPTVASVVASKPTFCSGGTDKTQVTLTFTGTPNFEFTYNGTGTPTSTGNVSKTSTTTTYSFDVTTAETFKVTALKDGNGCVATVLTPSATTSFFENPAIDTIMYECDPTNSEGVGYRYKIIFKGEKGDIATYKIDATDFTTNAVIASPAFVGNTWTSGYIDENVFVNIDFYDVNKCAIVSKPKLNRSCSCPEKIDLAFASGASTGSICEQGDSTSIKLTIVPTANGSGALLSDFKYNLKGPDGSILATEATPQPIRVNKAGKYLITDFTGKCTGTNDDLDVLNYTSPIAKITASDADFCLNGTDKGEVQLQVTTQSKPDYTFVVSRTAMTDTTISLVGVTSATFKTNKAGTYTINSVKDGNTCSAITKNGAAVMKGITPPVGKITSPAITPISYRDNDFTLTADALTADYRGQWLADSVGVLIGDTTTNLVGLRIPSFDNTKTIQWVVRDVNRVCPKDVQTVVITRKDFTLADIEPNKNVCIVPTTNFTLKGNPFTAGTETASWSVKSGSATVTADPSDNSKATFTPNGTGEYVFYYTILNTSLNKATKDSITVRVDAESATPTISLLTGPYNTALNAYKICAKDYTLPGVASIQGTLSRNWWEKVTGTGDITPSNLTDSIATPTLKSISGLVELKYWQKNGVCPAKDMSFFVDKVGDISVPKITITGGKLSDLTSKQYNDDSVTALIPADTLCFGGTYTITGTKLATETGTWSVLSGTSVGLTSDLTTQSQSLTINSASAIPTKLKWSITNGICPNPNTIEVDLIVRDVPTQPGIVGNPVACEGVDTTFKVSPASVSTLPITYNWSAGTGGASRSGSSIGTETKYKFTSDVTGLIISGAFDVTPTNRCGAGTAATKTVAIKLAPRAFNLGDTINGPKTFCATSTGVKYKLNNLQPNTTEYVWRWSDIELADKDTSTLVIGRWATDANSTATVTVELRNQCSASGIPQVVSQPVSVTITKPEALGVSIISNKLDSIFCVPQTQLVFSAVTSTNLSNLAATYEFSVNGSVVRAASADTAFSPAIGTIQDSDIVSVKITATDLTQCLASFTSSDDIVMQGFNFPDSSITIPAILKICGDGDQIELAVKRTKNRRGAFNDNSITWLKDGLKIATNTTTDTVYKLVLTQPSETGEYSVKMARNVCVDSSESITNPVVVIYEKPQFSFNIDPLVIIYQEGIVVPMPVTQVAPSMVDSKYVYSYRDGDTTWLRNPDSLVALIVPKREQKEWYYTLKVSNGDPAIPTSVCETTGSLRVINSLPLNIPNAFSPNGDGVNDTWVVTGLNRYTSVKVSVFNRWGNRVFYDNSGYKEPWDGNIGGVPLATGTYYAILELSGSPDNTDTNETRSLTIVR